MTAETIRVEYADGREAEVTIPLTLTALARVVGREIGNVLAEALVGRHTAPTDARVDIGRGIGRVLCGNYTVAGDPVRALGVAIGEVLAHHLESKRTV